MKSYDVIGNIAILKKDKNNRIKARKILKENKNIKTVLEKKEKVKGRLRTLKTRFLAGVKTKEALYRENGCLFRLNIDSCYFSPRLSEERKEIAKLINKLVASQKKGKVLVLFAGVGPFSCVIAKTNPRTQVTSIELGRECCKYALMNKKINKISNLEIFQGDVKRVIKKIKEKFDFIVMPRPQLKETFLRDALKVSKSKSIIFYYGFCREDELPEEERKLLDEAKKAKKKIKILEVKRAGEIAPYKFRFRIEIKVL